MPTFGTLVDPSHVVEIPDTSLVTDDGTTRTKRPAAGSELLVLNADDLTPLAPIVTDAYGYWSYTTADGIDWIKVSGDGGVTWVGPLQSIENKYASGTAGTNAATALANSVTALDTANLALATAGTGGSGGREIIWQTAPGVYPTPATSGPHDWYGTVRPTVAQGRQPGDKFYNVVTAAT